MRGRQTAVASASQKPCRPRAVVPDPARRGLPGRSCRWPGRPRPPDAFEVAAPVRAALPIFFPRPASWLAAPKAPVNCRIAERPHGATAALRRAGPKRGSSPPVSGPHWPRRADAERIGPIWRPPLCVPRWPAVASRPGVAAACPPAIAPGVAMIHRNPRRPPVADSPPGADKRRGRAADRAEWPPDFRSALASARQIVSPPRNETAPLDKRPPPPKSDGALGGRAGSTSGRKAQICCKPGRPGPGPRRWFQSAAAAISPAPLPCLDVWDCTGPVAEYSSARRAPVRHRPDCWPPPPPRRKPPGQSLPPPSIAARCVSTTTPAPYQVR